MCVGFTRAVVHGRISFVQGWVIFHSVYALGHRRCRESCCGVRCAVTSLKFRGFGYLLGSLAGLYAVFHKICAGLCFTFLPIQKGFTFSSLHEYFLFPGFACLFFRYLWEMIYLCGFDLYFPNN